MCEFDKLDKTFASDLYLIYKRTPSARVCISDKDQLLMFYLSLILHRHYHLYIYIYIYRTLTQAHGNGFCNSVGRVLVYYQPLSLWSSKRIHFHNVESVHVYCKRVYIDTKFSKPGQACSLQVNLIYSMCYTYDVSRLLN